MMKIEAIPTGAYEEICYLVSNTEGETIVLDPGETRVYPGHGPDTTIEVEKSTNFFMQ